MVAVVAAAALFWMGVFAIYFTAQGVSPLEFFLGAYESYDPRLGQWRAAATEPESELVREERFLLPDGRASASYLEHQVRYRDRKTLGIARVEAPRRVRRRRSRSVRS